MTLVEITHISVKWGLLCWLVRHVGTFLPTNIFSNFPQGANGQWDKADQLIYPVVQFRSEEENDVEERQCILPSLPARDPRFLQPPIYLCDKILF